jgi:hypothetical protein
MYLSLAGIGGRKKTFFTPGSRSGVALSTPITSRQFVLRVSGTAVPESGMTISINGAAYTASNTAVVAGDKVRARVTSSSSYATPIPKTLTIGATVLTFTVTTMSQLFESFIIDTEGAFLVDTETNNVIGD